MSSLHEVDTTQYRNILLRANSSPDGKLITVILPQEFIDAVMAFEIDRYGRHRLKFDPIYNGKEVKGYVAADSTKWGKLELIPSTLGLQKVIPSGSSRYACRERDDDILLGSLLFDLCDPSERPAPPPPKVTHVAAAVAFDAHQAPEFTIEAAIQFVNKWAVDTNATLIVENNLLGAEVRQRIGFTPTPPPYLRRNPTNENRPIHRRECKETQGRGHHAFG